LLATPTTLIALLKAVAYGWQQAQIARDAEQIRDVAINLHKKFVGLHASFLAIGAGLRKAGDAYDDALNKAEGHGGLFSIARKMRELKIGEKDIPDSTPTTIRPRAMQHDDWPGLALAANVDNDEPDAAEAKGSAQVAQ
jgi:DNA recombination protein RmuC